MNLPINVVTFLAQHLVYYSFVRIPEDDLPVLWDVEFVSKKFPYQTWSFQSIQCRFVKKELHASEQVSLGEQTYRVSVVCVF